MPVNDHRGAPEEPLAEQVQKQNTNLLALIDTITQIIAASRDLLRRLGGAKDGAPPDGKP